MLAISPRQTFPHVLKPDREMPRSRQTRFYLRFLAAGEAAEYRKLSETKEPAPGDLLKKLFAALRRIVADWAGVVDEDADDVPFDPDSLERVLTAEEAWELYYAGLARCRLDDDDRKNSASPSPS
jgi:hypothetical protein